MMAIGISSCRALAHGYHAIGVASMVVVIVNVPNEQDTFSGCKASTSLHTFYKGYDGGGSLCLGLYIPSLQLSHET